VGSAKPQLEMVVDDPAQAERDRVQAERARARDAADQKTVFDALLAACRDVAITVGYNNAANELDAIWSKQGRPVSASFLNATLNPDTREDAPPSRSYFRLEWIVWFAKQSAEVRDLLVAIGFDTPKDPSEELDDVYDVMREQLGKMAEPLIRQAKARRRRRR